MEKAISFINELIEWLIIIFCHSISLSILLIGFFEAYFNGDISVILSGIILYIPCLFIWK